jgi:hypothetical protein
MHCYVHSYAHTHLPSRARLVRAQLARPAARRRNRRGRVSAAAALTASSTSATRPPPAAPRARSCPRTCLPLCGRAGRLRPAPIARRSAARARRVRAGLGRGRRPATPPPPHPTPRGAARRPARQRHAQQRTAANAHGGGAAGAGRTVPPRACTGRATRGAPSPSCGRWTCRAPRARAARARRAPMGGRGVEPGRSHGKSPRMHAHTRMGVIDTPVHSERRLYAKGKYNSARGRIRARTSRNRTPTTRVSTKYMYPNIDGCPHRHIYI